MNKEYKDLCITCEHFWYDFEITPKKKYVAHCEILDAESRFKPMDDVIPYPCIECPFLCYIKENNNKMSNN